MDRYKIYCETDSKWEYMISSSLPTSCPSNESHTIRSESISIEEKDVNYTDGETKIVSLEDYKTLRINEVDERTRSLISQGFSFDGMVFSTSETAQRNWLALDSFRNDLTYPFKVSTKDSSQYSVIDAATMHSFALTGLATINQHYSSGSDLKELIRNATTEAEVSLVVDNR